MRRLALLAVLAATFGVLSSPVGAQQYPNRPIKIIVPATPGGTSDIFARAIGQRLEKSLGQPVIVDYKPGAGTNIGSDFVAKAAPDGYTFLINGITLAVNPLLYNNMTFDPAKDLMPVIEVAELVNVVTVNPTIPANNMKELLALIKAKPGTFNYGSPGVGSSGHLSGELFAMKTGTKITHIAYQGNSQAATDQLGGTLQMGFVNLPVALPFVKSNKLRALGVTSLKRSPALPDVPTVAEALNIPDYELTGWFGLMAPARTPPAIIAQIQQATDKALQDPGLREIFATAGGDIVGGSTAQFDARIKKDTARLGEVIKLSGASAAK